MTPDKLALAPCPLCRSDKVRVDRKSGVTGRVCRSRYYRERVICKACGASSGEHKAPGKAVAAWNRRATTVPPTVRGLVDEWRKAMEGVTPGPWRAFVPDRGYCQNLVLTDDPSRAPIKDTNPSRNLIADFDDCQDGEVNAAFIAFARNNISALLDSLLSLSADREAAKREGMEEAARLVCPGCREGRPIDGHDYHVRGFVTTPCHATAIRNRAEGGRADG